MGTMDGPTLLGWVLGTCLAVVAVVGTLMLIAGLVFLVKEELIKKGKG